MDLGNWHGVPHLCVPDQLPTYFTKEEFQKFVSRIRKQWFEDLVIVAVSPGMRRGKLLNLRWQDVDFGWRILHIHSSEVFKTKADKRRAVPMIGTVVRILERRILPPPTEYVFTSDGKRIHDDVAWKKFKRDALEAGINSQPHYHSLRHYAESRTMPSGDANSSRLNPFPLVNSA